MSGASADAGILDRCCQSIDLAGQVIVELATGSGGVVVDFTDP